MEGDASHQLRYTESKERRRLNARPAPKVRKSQSCNLSQSTAWTRTNSTQSSELFDMLASRTQMRRPLSRRKSPRRCRHTDTLNTATQ